MEETHFIFTSNPIQLKAEEGNFFVEGYISTSDLDLVNDIVTKSCLLDMAEQMKNRVIKFDVEHESFRGKSNLEREINKTTVPVAKVDDFLMDKKGLKVRAILNKNAARFNEVKGSIEDGFLDAFSIAYIPTKAVMQEKDGKEIRLLDKINLLNVAFTGNPVNTEAKMTSIFAKSLKFLEEQEKSKPKTRPKPKVPESEYEDEEDEDKEGPGGHKPDKTGSHGRGKGPGNGQADGSGIDKDKKKEQKDNHTSDIIKLQEAKMSEDNEKEEAQPENENAELENSESQEVTEQKDEETEEPEEDAEVKSLREEVKSLREEMKEIKSSIKAPIRKSTVSQQDKSKQFEGAEGKSLNPLDVI